MRLIIGIFTAALIGMTAWASQATPFPIQITQPDGTTLTVRLSGDEHTAWYHTMSGHTIIKNKTNGFWEYAAKDAAGKLTAGGVVVGKGAPPLASKNARPAWRRLPAFAGHLTQKTRMDRWEPRPVSGPRQLLIIRVNFADRRFQSDADADYWWQTVFAQAPAARSVVTFFNDNSFGQLTLSPVVHGQPGAPGGVVTVDLAEPHPNYGNGGDFDSTQAFYQAEIAWINQALAEAATFVDFAGYDVDNDGVLALEEMNIYFVLAGFDASTGPSEPNIWAHAWGARRSGDVSAGGVSIPRWAMNGERANSDRPMTMGVIAHELGHSVCGLPDLYDVDNGNSGLGWFSLMAAGSFGFSDQDSDPGMTPVGLDAWSRYFLGWSSPRQAAPGATLDFPSALSTTDAPLLLRNPAAATSEFFLVENRYPSGWDAGMASTLRGPQASVRRGDSSVAAELMRFSPVGTVTGVAIDCSLGRPADFPAEVRGRIALIQRGELTFREKTLNAAAAGALATVVYNNQPGGFSGTLGSADDYIPTVAVAAEDADLLRDQIVTVAVESFDWRGGLLILHIDQANSSVLNGSERNDHQGVMAEEASNKAGSLLAGSSPGHVSHLFYRGNNDSFTNSSVPNSKLYNGQASGLGLVAISDPGEMMSAVVASESATETPAYVIPWVVNNAQWLSKAAFFNDGDADATLRLVAVDREGRQAETQLNGPPAGGVLAMDSDALFGDMSGYSLLVYGPRAVYPSFLTYNLEAGSGRSPAKTRALAVDQLSARLAFGYLPTTAGGSAAVVLSAPLQAETAITAVRLSLHGPDGVVGEPVTVELTGRQPFAQVLSAVFAEPPEDVALVAESVGGAPLAGTTFVFNQQGEPAMTLPFATPN